MTSKSICGSLYSLVLTAYHSLNLPGPSTPKKRFVVAVLTLAWY